MSIKSLRYWVFTSGESGIHGLDWGIKHASEYFTDRQELDTDYRALLKDFGLPPSLERPANEVGLILLSWKKSDYIAGFIFAGMDHGDRPNTSSVICVIPGELVGRKSVNETLKSVWERNNIAEIAHKNSQHRPDTLRLESDSLVAGNAPYFRSPVSWPGINNGWFQIDGNQRELSRVTAVTTTVVQEEIKPSGGKLKIIVALVAVAITFSAAKYFSSHSEKTETSDRILPEVSGDVNQLESKDASNASNDTSSGAAERKRLAKIEKLRDRLTEFLAGTKPVVHGKKFTVRVLKWNEETQKRFDEILDIQKQIRPLKIAIEPAGKQGKSIEFTLRSPLSQGAAIGECIEAFIDQFKEDN